MTGRLGFVACIVAVTALLSACSDRGAPAAKPERAEIVVFAAASLAEPFEEIGRLVERDNPGLKITFSFGGSQLLRAQLEQGARADLYASASLTEMAKSRAANLVEDPRVFAHNELVVIYPESNPARITQLQDLARPGLKLDVAHRDVPVGGYTLAALDRMSAIASFGPDFKRRVLANVRSEEDDVKKVVTKVVLGEADAGIVYSSDVNISVKARVQTLAIPSELNVIADYPIARVRETRHPVEAKAFMDLLLSDTGRSILARHGFIPQAEGTT